jgi:hypothetical protein
MASLSAQMSPCRTFAPMGSWVMQRPTAVAAKHSLGRSRTHLQGAGWCPCMKPPPMRLGRADDEDVKPNSSTA